MYIEDEEGALYAQEKEERRTRHIRTRRNKQIAVLLAFFLALVIIFFLLFLHPYPGTQLPSPS